MKRQLILREFARSALEVQHYRFPEGALDDTLPACDMLREGRTGIPIVDASVRDLKNGLPRNRARLVLARFAIRNLNLDSLSRVPDYLIGDVEHQKTPFRKVESR